MIVNTVVIHRIMAV